VTDVFDITWYSCSQKTGNSISLSVVLLCSFHFALYAAFRNISLSGFSSSSGQSMLRRVTLLYVLVSASLSVKSAWHGSWQHPWTTWMIYAYS